MAEPTGPSPESQIAGVAPPAPHAAPPAPHAAPPPADAASATTPPAVLTPEEQMALFEKELKETDWGHQPC